MSRSDLKNKLLRKFQDKEYAQAYVESHTITKIGAQLMFLRKRQRLTQSVLAQRAAISQEKISIYENADFSSITLKTLFKLASALDVSLNVSFTEFSKTIKEIENFSEDTLTVASRDEDLEATIQQENAVVRSIRPNYAEPEWRIQTKEQVLQDLMRQIGSSFYISPPRAFNVIDNSPQNTIANINEDNEPKTLINFPLPNVYAQG